MDQIRDNKKRARKSSSSSAKLPVRRQSSEEDQAGPSFRLPRGFENLFKRVTAVNEPEKPVPKKRRERVSSSERMDVGPSARLESRMEALARKRAEDEQKEVEKRQRMEALEVEKAEKRAQAKLRARAKERADREGIDIEEALRLNMEESAERKRKAQETIERRRMYRARRRAPVADEGAMQVDQPQEAGPSSRRRRSAPTEVDAEMRGVSRAELRKEAIARQRAEAEAVAEAKREAEKQRRENKQFVKEEMDPLTALLSRTTLMGGKKKGSRARKEKK
jgi:hypothetical protein